MPGPNTSSGTQQAQAWLQRAHDDIGLARNGLSNIDYPYIAGAIYLAQQAVEKALKAYLYHKDQIPPRTHDLVSLLEKCQRFDQSFGILIYDCDMLNPHSTISRYPDSNVAMPFLDTAQFLVNKAATIVEFVDQKIYGI